MSEAKLVQEDKSPAKLWAEGFNKQDPFTQIQILNNLYTTSISLTLKLQILSLLIERVQGYQEFLFREERKLQQELGIVERVKELTCSLPNKEKL